MIYHYELFQIINNKINWDNKTINITENKDILYTQLIHYDTSGCVFENKSISLNYSSISKQWNENVKNCFTKWKLDTLSYIQNKDYLLIPFYITSSKYYIAIVLLKDSINNLPSFTIYGILSNISRYDTIKIFNHILETSYNDYNINIQGGIKISLNTFLKNIKNYLPRLVIDIKKIEKINFMSIYNKKISKKNL